MKIRSVGAELFHADGKTDMTKLIVIFVIFRTHLKTNPLMLYRAIFDVCSEIRKRYINAHCGQSVDLLNVNPYPTAFPYGNGMVLHFYQQQESSTTKTVHKVINKGLKTYV